MAHGYNFSEQGIRQIGRAYYDACKQMVDTDNYIVDYSDGYRVSACPTGRRAAKKR
jgi:hypothetical protein